MTMKFIDKTKQREKEQLQKTKPPLQFSRMRHWKVLKYLVSLKHLDWLNNKQSTRKFDFWIFFLQKIFPKNVYKTNESVERIIVIHIQPIEASVSFKSLETFSAWGDKNICWENHLSYGSHSSVVIYLHIVDKNMSNVEVCSKDYAQRPFSFHLLVFVIWR